jgi:hypothetical protein
MLPVLDLLEIELLAGSLQVMDLKEAIADRID